MNSSDKTQQAAIKAALNNDWQQAVDLNNQIVEEDPTNIQTLNRLGFAYIQLGQITKAKAAYKKVIDIDKYNPIAKKSLEKLSKVTGNTKPTHSNGIVKAITSFIEEPGKTKSVILVRPTDSVRIISLNAGTPTKLTPKKKTLSVESLEGDYIGCLPDDVGFRLAKLIKLGYTYETYIKNSQNKSISVFIKETCKPDDSSLISFPNNSMVRTINSISTTPSPIKDDPVDVRPTGEDE